MPSAITFTTILPQGTREPVQRQLNFGRRDKLLRREGSCPKQKSVIPFVFKRISIPIGLPKLPLRSSAAVTVENGQTLLRVRGHGIYNINGWYGSEALLILNLGKCTGFMLHKFSLMPLSSSRWRKSLRAQVLFWSRPSPLPALAAAKRVKRLSKVGHIPPLQHSLAE